MNKKIALPRCVVCNMQIIKYNQVLLTIIINNLDNVDIMFMVKIVNGVHLYSAFLVYRPLKALYTTVPHRMPT